MGPVWVRIPAWVSKVPPPASRVVARAVEKEAVLRSVPPLKPSVPAAAPRLASEDDLHGAGVDLRPAAVGVGGGERQRARADLGQLAGAAEHAVLGQRAGRRLEGAAAGEEGRRAGHGEAGGGPERAAVEGEAARGRAERGVGPDGERPLVDRGPAGVGVAGGHRRGERGDAGPGLLDLAAADDLAGVGAGVLLSEAQDAAVPDVVDVARRVRLLRQALRPRLKGAAGVDDHAGGVVGVVPGQRQRSEVHRGRVEPGQAAADRPAAEAVLCQGLEVRERAGERVARAERALQREVVAAAAAVDAAGDEGAREEEKVVVAGGEDEVSLHAGAGLVVEIDPRAAVRPHHGSAIDLLDRAEVIDHVLGAGLHLVLEPDRGARLAGDEPVVLDAVVDAVDVDRLGARVGAALDDLGALPDDEDAVAVELDRLLAGAELPVAAGALRPLDERAGREVDPRVVAEADRVLVGDDDLRAGVHVDRPVMVVAAGPDRVGEGIGVGGAAVGDRVAGAVGPRRGRRQGAAERREDQG